MEASAASSTEEQSNAELLVLVSIVGVQWNIMYCSLHKTQTPLYTYYFLTHHTKASKWCETTSFSVEIECKDNEGCVGVHF